MNRKAQTSRRGELTIEQRKAIKALEQALGLCRQANIQLCGMDGGVYFATKHCLEHYSAHIQAEQSKNFGAPPDIAIVQDKVSSALEDWAGEVNTHGVYKDSGGW